MITPFWKDLSSLFAKGCSCRVRYYSVHKRESVEKQSSSKQKSTSMVLFSNFMTVGGRGNLLVVSMIFYVYFTQMSGNSEERDSKLISDQVTTLF